MLGPVILMFAMGFGITFDVENLKYAAFDQDRTPESRRLLENFSGSRYFSEQAPISSPAEVEQRMRSGELAVAIEIPAGFGRDVATARSPDVAVWVDGAMPFRGETAKGYVTGLALRYAQDLVTERLGPNVASNVYLGGLNLENRFRYNQAFKSVFSMVPSVIMMMLVLIPAIMATVAVVREKETGSISNFRSTPVSKLEFLVGKQFPYIAVAMVSFGLLLLMSYIIFHVPITGSFGALVLGALVYVTATTAFGQLISTFTTDAGLSDLRVRCPLGHSDCEFLGPARACVVPLRSGQADRSGVSGRLVPARHSRDLRQGSGLRGCVAQSARHRRLRALLPRGGPHRAEEAGGLRCCRKARRPLRSSSPLNR